MKILTNTRATVSGLAVAVLAASGVALSAAPAQAASTSTWDRVAACESGGDWHISTGNGYYGGLQFSMSTWRGYGGSGNPANASKGEQIRIAEKVLAGQGWGAWPVCSVKAGARGESASVRSAPAPKRASSGSSSHRATGSTTSKRAAVQAPARHRAAVKLSGDHYTVKPGDSLSSIAKKMDVEQGWARLADANPSVQDPDLIFVGQRLALPA